MKGYINAKKMLIGKISKSGSNSGGGDHITAKITVPFSETVIQTCEYKEVTE